MKQISYGFWQPEDGDKGSIWFPRLVDNFIQIAAHNHDGLNSSKIAVTAIVTPSVTLGAGDWEFVSEGVYKQRVALPSGLTYDSVIPSFRDSTTGEIIMLSPAKYDDTHMDVFVNDSTVSLSVIFR